MNRRLFLASLASVAAASSALLTGCATTGLVSYRQAISRGRLSLRVADYPELGNDGGAIEITTDDVADPIVIVR